LRLTQATISARFSPDVRKVILSFKTGNIEVWDVKLNGTDSIPTTMALPLGSNPPTQFVFKVVGNSSYPHQWHISDSKVASLTVDPNDSRIATIIPREPGKFWFKVQDSAEIPFQSLTIEVK